jgi:hypothetical protein
MVRRESLAPAPVLRLNMGSARATALQLASASEALFSERMTIEGAAQGIELRAELMAWD